MNYKLRKDMKGEESGSYIGTNPSGSGGGIIVVAESFYLVVGRLVAIDCDCCLCGFGLLIGNFFKCG